MLETVPIEIWSDYACPWCFLTAQTLQKLAQSHPVAIRWRAFELRPKDGPPVPAEYLAKVQAKRPKVYNLIHQQHGLVINPGPFGIDSRPAHIGAKVAASVGCSLAYHAGVMHAYWLDAQTIDHEHVLANIAAAAGMEQEWFLDALTHPRFQQAVLDDLTYARQQGFRTAPTLIFANQFVASGAQSLASLQQIIEQILTKQMEKA